MTAAEATFVEQCMGDLRVLVAVMQEKLGLGFTVVIGSAMDRTAMQRLGYYAGGVWVRDSDSRNMHVAQLSFVLVAGVRRRVANLLEAKSIKYAKDCGLSGQTQEPDPDQHAYIRCAPILNFEFVQIVTPAWKHPCILLNFR